MNSPACRHLSQLQATQALLETARLARQRLLERDLAEVDARAPVTDKRGHLWLRATAAQKSVELLRFAFAENKPPPR